MFKGKALNYGIIVGATLVLFFALLALSGNLRFTYASTTTNTLVANVAVTNVIYLSVSPNAISFGSLYPSGSYDANVQVTDTDNGGNIEANMLVEGTAWTYGSNSMGVSNTLWNPTALSGSGGTQLSGTFTNTGIIIPQPTLASPSTSNNIYFGVTIPAGTPPGNYVQTISFENENTTYSTYNSVSSAYTVTASVSVLGVCFISLSPTSLNFGSIAANANVPTNNLVTDSDSNGDAAATIFVEGTSWNSISNTLIGFGVSNTLWSASSLGTYSGNALTNTLTSTGIIIAAPTQANPTTNSPIYFGLGVPGGTPAGSYSQTITIENSC
jgi:hypothetical protein